MAGYDVCITRKSNNSSQKKRSTTCTCTLIQKENKHTFTMIIYIYIGLSTRVATSLAVVYQSGNWTIQNETNKEGRKEERKKENYMIMEKREVFIALPTPKQKQNENKIKKKIFCVLY